MLVVIWFKVFQVNKFLKNIYFIEVAGPDFHLYVRYKYLELTDFIFLNVKMCPRRQQNKMLAAGELKKQSWRINNLELSMTRGKNVYDLFKVLLIIMAYFKPGIHNCKIPWYFQVFHNHGNPEWNANVISQAWQNEINLVMRYKLLARFV